MRLGRFKFYLRTLETSEKNSHSMTYIATFFYKRADTVSASYYKLITALFNDCPCLILAFY